MQPVAELTGQSRLLGEIDQLLSSEQRPAIFLRGSSGSGKTWTCQQVVKRWQAAGGTAFIATGDELFVRRPHFPLLLAVSLETARAQSKAVAKLILEPITAIPFGGKPLHEVLLQLFERKESTTLLQTPFLSQEDREIFTRMQKASSKRRALLICDNLQWWDEGSLEALGLAFTSRTRDVFPFLEHIAVIAVETTKATQESPNALRPLLTSVPWHHLELSSCTADSFGGLLRAFGFTSPLPQDLVQRLFAICGGHLELIRRIAEADTTTPMAPRWSEVDSTYDFLKDLLERRLEKYESVPDETAAALRAAAIIGSSFAENELTCLLDDHSAQLASILEPAERLRLLERSGNVRMFVHDLIHSYYLQHGQSPREALHERFANCLRLIHSGDYARRAEHLRRSGNRRGLGEMVVLEGLRAIRAGSPPLLRSLEAELDEELSRFLETMHAAHGHFERGDYLNAISSLEAVEDVYADALMAERDILLARSNIKLLSHDARKRACSLLLRWDSLKDVEPEVWGRAMLYLVVAMVFVGDEAGARETERRLYRGLAGRVNFDPTVPRTINHLRLKSNMLHTSQVARERLLQATQFFSGVGGVSEYDPLHQCIALVNIAANHIVEGEYEAALAYCDQANSLIHSEQSMIFGRLDILMTNLTLAGYLSGKISTSEALESARQIWGSAGQNNDSSLLASNVAYFLAREGKYAAAIDILQPIYSQLLGPAEIDSYYTYFVGNNLSGSLYECGRKAESEELWRTITPYVGDFFGQPSAYIARRHDLQGQIFKAATRDWDTFLAGLSPQVGPGWRFYGNGFLPSELEYWSDE